jgi:hypothetical protein
MKYCQFMLVVCAINLLRFQQMALSGICFLQTLSESFRRTESFRRNFSLLETSFASPDLALPEEQSDRNKSRTTDDLEDKIRLEIANHKKDILL